MTNKRDAEDVIDDPDNYARMIVPHNTPEEAAAAWKGFWDDVYEARKKHRISEAVIVGQVLWNDENGKKMGSILTGSMGNEVTVLRILAYAYGEMKVRFEKILMALENPRHAVKKDD